MNQTNKTTESETKMTCVETPTCGCEQCERWRVRPSAQFVAVRDVIDGTVSVSLLTVSELKAVNELADRIKSGENVCWRHEATDLLDVSVADLAWELGFKRAAPTVWKGN